MPQPQESLHSKTLSPDEREFRKIEHVFITHGHFDHIARIPAIYRKAPLKLWCTQTPYKTLLREGVRREQMQVIRPGAQLIYHLPSKSERLSRTILTAFFFLQHHKSIRCFVTLFPCLVKTDSK